MPTPQQSTRKAKPALRTLSRFITVFFALAFLLSASLAPIGAITQSEINALKQKQQELNANKTSIQSQLGKVQNDTAKIVEQKHLLEEQIEIILSELRVTNELIAGLDKEIEAKGKELAEAEAEAERYYALFAERVRAMEEGGDVSYWSILFSSENFSDLIDRFNMIGEIMEYDNSMLDALEAARAAVEQAKTDLESLRAEHVAAKQSLEASNAQLKTQQQQLDAILRDLESKADQYEKQLDAYAEDSHNLSNELAAAERQYAAQLAAQRPSGSGSSSGQVANLTGSGGFIWPLPSAGKLTSPYGNRKDPFSGRTSFHGGTDIAIASGTPIYAAKAGTVVISTYNSSYGNYVVIAHPDGSKTLYAHQKARACSAGQSVSQGQTIGYVGTTGSSTGNHLHFEVWRGSSSSTRVNPMNFF